MKYPSLVPLFSVPLLGLVALLFPASAWANCGDFPGFSPGQTPPYSPALLVKTYQCVRAAYDPSQPYIQYMDLIGPLEQAGVEKLLVSSSGVTAEQRIQILNDYGFWLYKQGFTYAHAAKVLQTVVQLAPRRAVAWLNLGDTYAAMLTSGVEDDGIPQTNATWTGKQKLSREAVDAYSHYVALSPHPDQHVKNFLALNILNAPQGNVCQFVTAFVRQRREEELAINQITRAIPVDLLGDGVKYYVYIYYTGSNNIPDIDAYTSPQKDVGPYYGDQHPGDVDFDPLDFLSGDDGGTIVNPGDRLYLLPFKNLYYVLRVTFSSANAASDPSDRPIESADILQPNNGVICGIRSSLTPSLSVSEDNPLCNHFLLGDQFPQPNRDSSLADSNIVLAPGMGGNFRLVATSDVDFENDGRKQLVAYYNYSSGAGAGCELNGIMLYDSKNRTALLNTLGQVIRQIPFGCGNPGNEFLITYGGKIYIETDHWKATLPGEAKGQAIYEARDDKIIPVCIIDNKFTYTTQQD